MRLRWARLPVVLGIEVPHEEAAGILERLGCAVVVNDEGLTARVPFERGRDLTREIDLIEEIARIHGLDRIPTAMPRVVGRGRRTPAQALEHRLARLAADLGLSEAVTYHMVPESDADALRLAGDDPRRQVVRLAHPMSAEMAVMRRSMLPGLLRAVARNQAHQRADGGLFEIGRTYAPLPDGQAEERPFLAAVRWGRVGGEGWRDLGRPADLYAVSGLAATLARAARVEVEAQPNAAPYFHPGRQARLTAGDLTIGWVGEVHPLVLRAFDAAPPVAALVLDLDALLAAGPAEPPRSGTSSRSRSPPATWPWSCPRPCAPPTWWPPRAPPAARSCSRCTSSTATRASRWSRAT